MPVFLSKNLVYLRKLKGFTQKDLAGKIGVTPSAYGNYENNYSQPNYEILEDITKILGIMAHEILYSDLQAGQYKSVKDGEKKEPEQPNLLAMAKQFADLQKEVDEIKKGLKK